MLRGLRWAATFWCQCYVKEHLVPLCLYCCAGGILCSSARGSRHDKSFDALVLADGWEPVWHKDVAFSFSLGTEVTTLDENDMISSGSGPKACVAGNPAQLPNSLALATANPLPFPLPKPRARRH